MRFEETSLLKIERENSTRVKQATEMLTAFMESGIEVAEVKDWEDTYKSLSSCAQALYYAIKTMSADIKVKQRNGHIFIARADV